MNNLYKSPGSSNMKTGNVCLSRDEFFALSSGGYDHIIALECTIPTQKFMIDYAKDMGDYFLVPVFRSSFLVKRSR